MTLFQVKCELLTQMYDKYNRTEHLADLFAMNNLGFPLAWSYANGLVNLEQGGIDVIEETWEAVLELFGLTDTGFTNLSEIYSA